MCGVVLTLVDLDTGDAIQSELVGSGTYASTSVTINTGLLLTNRHYNVTIRASNVAGSAVSHTLISNKHHFSSHAMILRNYHRYS